MVRTAALRVEIRWPLGADRRRGLVVTLRPMSGGAPRDASRALLTRARAGCDQVTVTRSFRGFG